MIIIILISSKREKRHAKLYCAEWHNSCWYVGPETVCEDSL